MDSLRRAWKNIRGSRLHRGRGRGDRRTSSRILSASPIHPNAAHPSKLLISMVTIQKAFKGR